MDVAEFGEMPDAGIDADLLVGADAGGEVPDRFQPEIADHIERGEERGNRPLHVRDAAPVDAPIVQFRTEGVVIPLLLDGHGVHVRVDRQRRFARFARGDEVDALAFERQWDRRNQFGRDDDALRR